MVERRLIKCSSAKTVLVGWSVLLTTIVLHSSAAAAAAAVNVSSNSNLSQSVIRKGTESSSSSTFSPILQIPSPFTGCHQRSVCAHPHPPHNAFVSQEQQQQQSPGVARNCFCDDQCSIYDDCCDDLRNSSSPAGGGGGGGGRSLRPFVQCQRMASSSSSSSSSGGDRATNTSEVYVITRCLNVTYHDPYVRERCEKPYKIPATDDDDRFYRLPVRGGPPFYLLYRNTFCAVCSGDDDHFTFWSAVLRCGGGGDGGGVPSSAASAAAVNGSSPLRAFVVHGVQDCSTAFVPSRESLQRPAPRPCRVSIGRCDPSWTQDKGVLRKCRERTDYVFAGTRTFRNRECAICNYVNETYIRCEDNRQTTMTSSPEAEANSKIVVEEFVHYSVVLDFNRRRASISLSRDSDGRQRDETTIVFPECSRDRVYDPFVDRCRLISCRHGYSRRKEDCVPDDSAANAEPSHNRPIDEAYDEDDYLVNLPEMTSEPTLTSVTSSSAQCRLQVVNATDLVRLDNGSTYIWSLRTIISPQHQLISNADHVHVCLPELHETGNHEDRMFASRRRYNFTMFQFDAWQRSMSLAGAVVCLVAIFVQLLVYAMFTSLWATTDGKSIVCLSLSLFLAQLLYLFAVLVWGEELPGPMVCFVVCQVMQYFFVAAFCWLNVLSIDVFRWLKSSDPSSSTYSYIAEGECCTRFVWYSIYAWTVPLIVVTGSASTVVLRIDGWHPYEDRSSPGGGGGGGGCWVLGLSQLMLFALPICLMLAVNGVLFVVAVCKFCFESFPGRVEHQRNKYKQRCIVALQLSAVMGMTWLFAVLGAVTRRPFLWSLFIVFDALQGLFLCSAFVCTRKVWRLFCAKNRIRRLSDGTYARSSSSSSSSSGSKFRSKGGSSRNAKKKKTTTTTSPTKSKNRVIMLETSI